MKTPVKPCISSLIALLLATLSVAAGPLTRPAAPATRALDDATGKPTAHPSNDATFKPDAENPKPPATLPAGVQETTFRITGLFSPDRADDLRACLDDIATLQLVSLDFDHAEGLFRFDPKSAFPDARPDEITGQFNQKLLDASGHTLGIAPLFKTPRDKLTRVEIRVAPLDCKACALAVYEIVAKDDGVAQATASMRDGRITALIDPVQTSIDKLKAALKQREVTLAPESK